VLTDCGAHRADLVVIRDRRRAEHAVARGLGRLARSGAGIVVGPDLSTSVPDVFAAGDCTSVVWCIGCQRPSSSGTRRAIRVASPRDPFSASRSSTIRGTWYNSAKLMDVEYTTVGLVNQPGDRNWSWEETDACGAACASSTTRRGRSSA
jgi:hypothetical protein